MTTDMLSREEMLKILADIDEDSGRDYQTGDIDAHDAAQRAEIEQLKAQVDKMHAAGLGDVDGPEWRAKCAELEKTAATLADGELRAIVQRDSLRTQLARAREGLEELARVMGDGMFGKHMRENLGHDLWEHLTGLASAALTESKSLSPGGVNELMKKFDVVPPSHERMNSPITGPVPGHHPQPDGGMSEELLAKRLRYSEEVIRDCGPGFPREMALIEKQYIDTIHRLQRQVSEQREVLREARETIVNGSVDEIERTLIRIDSLLTRGE